MACDQLKTVFINSSRQRRQNCVPPPWIEDAELNRLSSHDQHPTIASHVEISTGGDESLSQGAVVVELTKRCFNQWYMKYNHSVLEID
ncbi:hypothetical protein T4D_10177 [Trichinella pseudospiralis]|uniref:Uncharacterized protein n=1 Tax=Trichinella pseudospiralis TaxID=6337 RepID=A0A0V1FVC7_TRIPS|nr:hypothetical protein T4D_10177 [Trichinella pseudospiralis]